MDSTPTLQNTFFAPFRERVNRDPEHLALDGPGVSLTYGQLDRRSNTVARRLLESEARPRGATPILTDDYATLIVSILGSLKAGRFHVVLNPRERSERVRQILDDVSADVIVTDDATSALARTFAANGRLVLPVNEEESDEPRAVPAISLDDLAYLVYTSGSTGAPKGIAWSHRRWVFGAISRAQEDSFVPKDRMTLLHPPGFATGAYLILTGMATGITQCPFRANAASISELADWIEEKNITLYHSVPSLFRQLTEGIDPGRRFDKVRIVRFGGEAVTRNDIELQRRHFPNAIVSFGLAATEAGIIALRTIGPDSPLEDHILHCGYPPDDVFVEILGEDDRPVAAGEVGEIVVRGPLVSQGYWNRPDLTDERFRDDPDHPGWRIYRTSDFGRFLPDGALVHMGRKDKQIKIRGHLVSPAEIEAIIANYPEVRQAAVVGQPTEYGTALAAWIVTSDPLDAKELRSRLAATLPAHTVPTIVRFVDELPRNAAGKIDRKELSHRTEPTAGEPAEPPRDETERRVVEIWSRALGIPTVAPNDDFFEIGGDSLRAALVFAAIEKEFGRRIPLASLMQAPTPASQAAILRRVVDPSFDLLVPIRLEGTRPPLFLVSGGGGNIVGFKDLTDALGEDQPVWGLQAPELEEQDERGLGVGVERSADMYADGIRAVQPRGPWCIAGYSAGALYAYETARRLDESGRDVALLAILDANVSGDAPRTIAERILVRWRMFRAHPLRQLRRTIIEVLHRTKHAYRYRRRIRLELTGKQVPPHLRDVARSRTRALKRYVPTPWNGSILLLRSSSWARKGPTDPMLGWGSLVLGRIDVQEVPGNHLQFIHEPYAGNVARVLRDAMDRAIELRGASGATGDTRPRETERPLASSGP